MIAAVGSSDADDVGDDLGLFDFEGEGEKLFGNDWDPTDFPNELEGLPISADDVELDSTLNVIQQDLQKERESMEHPRSGP
eukprot:61105-Amphidinium_carterae.1